MTATKLLTAPFRALLWLLDLDDGRGNPSFSKIVAAVFVAVTVKLLLNAKLEDLGPATVALILALLAASFGRSVFLRYLDRSNINLQAQANYQRIDTTTRQIIEQRDPERGIDPA